jgi:hypothetical protein
VFVACLSVNALAGPRVEIPQGTFNFGIAPQHRELTHSFWIKSVGDDTLRITKVVPGCACTSVPLTDSVIAPGDSAALQIVFKTGRYRGRITKKPHIITNASDEKIELNVEVEVVLEGDDVGPLAIRPERLDVSQFGPKLRRRSRFQLENRTDQDLNITVVDSIHNSFDIKLPRKITVGETAEGLITVHEDKYETAFQESATIRVDDPNGFVYSLPVRRLYRPNKK